VRGYRELLRLTDEQRSELTQWAQSRTLPAGDVFRAKLILALAQGKSYSRIAAQLQTSRPTIARWKERFEAAGIAGLDPQYKGTKPRVATPELQAKILRRTLKSPEDGSTHWTCRKMAKSAKVSKSTVQRIWAQARLKPHRLERYMASNDPDFEKKATEIIRLYLNPPHHAAVFCVDEKTAIEALDRLDPVLPLSPGRAERHGFEYYRHGTLSLYAALNAKTGKAEGKTASRHTSAEFISFLEGVFQNARWAHETHIVWITYQRTRHRQSQNFCNGIQKFGSTSRRPTRRGLIRLKSGSPKSNAISLLAACSPRCQIWPAKLRNTFAPIPNLPSLSDGSTLTLAIE
jgi:hypothetical protein